MNEYNERFILGWRLKWDIKLKYNVVARCVGSKWMLWNTIRGWHVPRFYADPVVLYFSSWPVTRSILMIRFNANTVSHISLWWYRSLMMEPMINKKSECAIKNNEKVSFNLSWDCFVWLFANIRSGNGNEWKPFLFIYITAIAIRSIGLSLLCYIIYKCLCQCVCVCLNRWPLTWSLMFSSFPEWE